MNQAHDGLFHVERLIHHQLELGARRQAVLDVLDATLHAIGHRQAAGPLLAIDGHVDLTVAVDADARGLDAVGIPGFADVAQIDAVARLDADGKVVQFLDVGDHEVRVEQKIVAKVRCSRRDHLVSRASFNHIDGRDCGPEIFLSQ